MLFDVATATVTFQKIIHQVLCEYLEQRVVMYLNDILVYSGSQEEHVQQLQDEELPVSSKQSVFQVWELEFLSYTV